MGRKYAIRNQDEFYFVTFTVVEWIDVFIREEYIQIFLDSLQYCQKHKGLEVGAWCVMTSHIHLILRAGGSFNLQEVIRDLKSYTSRHIRKQIMNNTRESRREWMLSMMEKLGTEKSNNKDFQFWQQHNHPIELNTNDLTIQRLDYVHQNPVKSGYVSQARDWVYSSARDYEDEKGCIEISYLY